MDRCEIINKITMETYEEKYNRALENFKKIKVANSDNKKLVNFIECEYPELKESEDEKWRNWLIGHLKGYINQTDDKYAEVCKKAIAWLEKQGEQHNVWNVEDEHNLKAALGYIEDEYLRRWFKDIVYAKFEKQDEQRSWSEEDEKMLEDTISCLSAYQSPDISKGLCYQEQIDWLKSIKPQPKYKWTDEDEKNLKDLLAYGETKLGLRRWIAGLPEKLGSRSEYHWKPSEEQMEALKKECIAHSNYQLCRLLEELEKL